MRVIDIVLMVAIAAVFVTLCFGVWNMFSTDPKSASRSNKLMRARVLLQFLAVIILLAGFYWLKS